LTKDVIEIPIEYLDLSDKILPCKLTESKKAITNKYLEDLNKVADIVTNNSSGGKTIEETSENSTQIGSWHEEENHRMSVNVYDKRPMISQI